MTTNRSRIILVTRARGLAQLQREATPPGQGPGGVALVDGFAAVGRKDEEARLTGRRSRPVSSDVQAKRDSLTCPQCAQTSRQ